MTVLSPGDASLLSSLARIVWVCIKYIHMRYWPSVRSKWLDVGRVLFFCVFMDFILPACAASYMIKWLTEQDIYWPIICYPISRSQVSTCCLFPAQEWNWTFELQYSTKIVSWWSNEPFFFFFFFPLALYDRFISSRTEVPGKNTFYSWSQVYISFFVVISSPRREGRKWIDK